MLSYMIETQAQAQMQEETQLHFFFPNDITDYIVIQHTFKDNVENKALVLIKVVHKFKNC